MPSRSCVSGTDAAGCGAWSSEYAARGGLTVLTPRGPSAGAHRRPHVASPPYSSAADPPPSPLSLWLPSKLAAFPTRCPGQSRVPRRRICVTFRRQRCPLGFPTRRGDSPSTLGGWSRPAPGYFRTLCSRTGLSHDSPPTPSPRPPSTRALRGLRRSRRCLLTRVQRSHRHSGQVQAFQDVLKVRVYFKYVRSKDGTKPLKCAFVSYECKLSASLSRVKKGALPRERWLTAARPE